MLLIVGGAGYIGSAFNFRATEAGYETVVFDNFSTGHPEFCKWGETFRGSLLKPEDIEAVFSKYKISCVLHFAAHAYVGESVVEPEKYYINNVVGTLNLLTVMKKYNVKNFVFSSSCATFGIHDEPINELTEQKPINPYGQTKLIIEKVLDDYDRAYGIKSVCLRYFNASGAIEESEVGEWHDPETHLVPLTIKASIDPLYTLKIFGDDYSTDDGTCVRDYIHIDDLASAHLLAVKHLLASSTSKKYNLGNGKGFSVLNVIQSVERVLGRKVKYEIVARRPGDPAQLVSDSQKITRELGWTPQRKNLDEIVLSAWKWHLNSNKL